MPPVIIDEYPAHFHETCPRILCITLHLFEYFHHFTSRAGQTQVLVLQVCASPPFPRSAPLQQLEQCILAGMMPAIEVFLTIGDAALENFVVRPFRPLEAVELRFETREHPTDTAVFVGQLLDGLGHLHFRYRCLRGVFFLLVICIVPSM